MRGRVGASWVGEWVDGCGCNSVRSETTTAELTCQQRSRRNREPRGRGRAASQCCQDPSTGVPRLLQGGDPRPTLCRTCTTASYIATRSGRTGAHCMHWAERGRAASEADEWATHTLAPRNHVHKRIQQRHQPRYHKVHMPVRPTALARVWQAPCMQWHAQSE